MGGVLAEAFARLILHSLTYRASFAWAHQSRAPYWFVCVAKWQLFGVCNPELGGSTPTSLGFHRPSAIFWRFSAEKPFAHLVATEKTCPKVTYSAKLAKLRIWTDGRITYLQLLSGWTCISRRRHIFKESIADLSVNICQDDALSLGEFVKFVLKVTSFPVKSTVYRR